MWRALCLTCLLGLATLPVRAGMFDDEEARARIEKLRGDVGELDKRTELTTKNQFDFANQLEAIKADVAKLRGQIEVIVNELEATQKRQKDFYIDLDTRLRTIESAAAAAKAEAKPEAAAEAPKVDPASEMREYEAALTLFKTAKYKEAQAAFLAFVKNYPGSASLPSAHYWAASSFYQLKDYGRAAELFGHLAAAWPDDSKAPDALLAQANAQLEGGDAKNGRRSLEILIEKYPASTAALSAKSRLKSLPAAKKK